MTITARNMSNIQGKVSPPIRRILLIYQLQPIIRTKNIYSKDNDKILKTALRWKKTHYVIQT
jgi:hypothetical protein